LFHRGLLWATPWRHLCWAASWVDPLSRMLEVFRGHENGWLLMGVFTEDQRVRAEPFDAIELVLEMLWPVVTSP